jgi:hypothetical protein
VPQPGSEAGRHESGRNTVPGIQVHHAQVTPVAPACFVSRHPAICFCLPFCQTLSAFNPWIKSNCT